jgi:hypothetical protein
LYLWLPSLVWLKLLPISRDSLFKERYIIKPQWRCRIQYAPSASHFNPILNSLSDQCGNCWSCDGSSNVGYSFPTHRAKLLYLLGHAGNAWYVHLVCLHDRPWRLHSICYIAMVGWYLWLGSFYHWSWNHSRYFLPSSTWQSIRVLHAIHPLRNPIRPNGRRLHHRERLMARPILVGRRRRRLRRDPRPPFPPRNAFPSGQLHHTHSSTA